jgi:hypothetical protein
MIAYFITPPARSEHLIVRTIAMSLVPCKGDGIQNFIDIGFGVRFAIRMVLGLEEHRWNRLAIPEARLGGLTSVGAELSNDVSNSVLFERLYSRLSASASVYFCPSTP